MCLPSELLYNIFSNKSGWLKQGKSSCLGPQKIEYVVMIMFPKSICLSYILVSLALAATLEVGYVVYLKNTITATLPIYDTST